MPRPVKSCEPSRRTKPVSWPCPPMARCWPPATRMATFSILVDQREARHGVEGRPIADHRAGVRRQSTPIAARRREPRVRQPGRLDRPLGPDGAGRSDMYFMDRSIKYWRWNSAPTAPCCSPRVGRQPRLWNAATGQLYLELRFHDFATAVAFAARRQPPRHRQFSFSLCGPGDSDRAA